MKKNLTLLWSSYLAFYWLNLHTIAMAATEKATVSTTGTVLKMVFALAIVLAVLALVSWGVKRMMPNTLGKASVMRVVGAANVGSRERVVVLEIAGRWLVVGVAPGQVNSIANLEIGSSPLSDAFAQESVQQTPHRQEHPLMQPLIKPFAEVLRKSAKKATSALHKTTTNGDADAEH